MKRKADERRRDLARQVRLWSVSDFHDQLVEADVRRLFVVYENGEFTLSHPKLLAPIQAFFELSQDFAEHEGVFIAREDGIPTLFLAFVHDTRRGLAQGGLRFKPYGSLADVLVDGLRLAQGMTRKNALAGLWWGGGKGVVPVTPEIDTSTYETEGSKKRLELFRAYGRFIASLGGVYYTAEDVGTKTSDMNAVLAENRFTTCIGSELGGSGNPSPFTARGVFRAMQAAWRFLTGDDQLRGVRVAVQGAGNVGRPLIEFLDDAGAQVWFCDVKEQAVRSIQEERPDIQDVEPEQIYDLDVDIFAPCAGGATVNAQTIPRLKARLVCGAANNILNEPITDAKRLQEKNIAFVPDYVCNRMGITNCADEWQGYLKQDIQVAAERVFPDTSRVLKHARNLVVTTIQAADDLADIAASELHPLFGHRGRRIIDHLVASKWHQDKGRPDSRVGELPFEPILHEPDIRMAWEQEGRFRGEGPRIAAAPISAASRPNLASFLSSTLMDVQARAMELSHRQSPRRVLGSDHGGLAVQLAIERSIPHEREHVGRPRFVEMCRDLHSHNDETIRQQLHELGVGFDPRTWLDTMNVEGVRICERLFYVLSDSGTIVREKRLAYRCPHCQTVLVSSDVARAKIDVEYSYMIRFRTRDEEQIETFTFFPELVLGMVAVAVKPNGRFGWLKGQRVVLPLDDSDVPVIAVPELKVEAEFIVPSYSQKDEQIARRHGITEYPSVLDDTGRVCFRGSGRPQEEAREEVLKLLGEQVTRTPGGELDTHRCRRCKTIVYPSLSEQLFVKLDKGSQLLRQAIKSGAVQLSDPRSEERVLGHLEKLEPWCISRQLWWGNPIPNKAEEVLSTWFSLVAWSLQGAGWPDEPAPAPIEKVFVDPDLLIRWVIPSQLVSLMITGRPVFRRIEVHGSLHVVQRSLSGRDGADESASDEERFLLRSARRPMRRRLGNVAASPLGSR